MNPQQLAEQYASSQYDVNQYTEPDSVKGTGWTDCRDAWLAGFNVNRWIPVSAGIDIEPEIKGASYSSDMLCYNANTGDSWTGFYNILTGRFYAFDDAYNDYKPTHYQIIKTPTL